MTDRAVCRHRSPCGLWLLVVLAFGPSVLGAVTFFVEPNRNAASQPPDSKADLAFQTALGKAFTELDLDENGSGFVCEPEGLCAGGVRVSPHLLDARGNRAADPATNGKRLIEAYALLPGAIVAAAGMVDGTCLLNRAPAASGASVVGAGVAFTFSRPVKGFGVWVLDDFQEANGFVLKTVEVGGATSTSGVLESGNGATLSIEGFLAAVSPVGIEKVIVEQRTLDGKPSDKDFFYLDHLQIGRADADDGRNDCVPPPAIARVEEVGGRFLDLVRRSKTAAALVMPAGEAPIWVEAEKLIAGTAQRWGGCRPNVVRLAKDAPLPTGNLILLGTPETHSAIAALCNVTESAVSRVPFLDDHGFVIESRDADGAKRLILAGKTPRGAYNGAVLCRDFLLDATPGAPGEADVFVRSASICRSPRLAVRGTYTLSFYGRAVEYTAEDWMRIVDRFAEDGMNRVNFWLSGHHPSKKYPHLYNVDDPSGQSTRGTKLTVDGVRRLIRHCHDRGIEFFIGGGVFAWCASEQLAKGHPEIRADCPPYYGLCPSKPFARTGVREHFLEMYDTWPEADGFMFEIRDEYGECRCLDCQVRLDEFGSKQYGRAEITWLQEFAREAWKKNPALRFCWLIGYAEHARDVYYYDQIRRMSDPRFEWLDTRVGLPGPGNGALPGPGGIRRPFTFFSSRIQHWDQFYTLPIPALLANPQKVAEHGLNGYVVAFEPGPWVGSSSYYGDVIPLPVDILPYCMMGFAYREATWNPGITLDEFRKNVHRRYFSPEAPARLADDMIYLHQFSLDHWPELRLYGKYGRPRTGPGGERPEPTIAGQLKRVRAISDEKQRQAESAALLGVCRKLAAIREDLARIDEIEAAMNQAAPMASPKTRDGFSVLRRMIDDTRDLYREAVPDPTVLADTIKALGG
jgi:hypothetical protein